MAAEDAEKQQPESDGNDPSSTPESTKKTSAFQNLGFLDRFLALWVFLSMVIGILIGNFVPSASSALEKGEFVGVSIPIGMHVQSVFM